MRERGIRVREGMREWSRVGDREEGQNRGKSEG